MKVQFALPLIEDEGIEIYRPCKRSTPGHRNLLEGNDDVPLECDHGGLPALEIELKRLGFSLRIPHRGGECPWVNLFPEIEEIRALTYERSYRGRSEEATAILQRLYLELGDKGVALGITQKGKK